jgi:hypothetical protein
MERGGGRGGMEISRVNQGLPSVHNMEVLFLVVLPHKEAHV